ncbi:MAG TPA: methyltransferase domain-containing protein [Patescibacteria group bacterium]|nr:methyltransferase domain-containing protein [Patescibacteria group bacterium]
MKMPSEESLWNNALPAFTRYENHRLFFRSATKEIVTRNLAPYLTSHAICIEIGSGLGELVYNNLPKKLQSRVLQTEQGKKLIVEHTKLHPDSNVTAANAYYLPFPDHIADVIVGYASFDTFLDLDKALSEVKRVLKKGGVFIHFLDLRACPETPLRPYINDPIYTLLPALTKKKTSGTFLKIPKQFLQEYVSSHTVDYKKWYEEFIANPEKAYDAINRSKINSIAAFSLQNEKLFGKKGFERIDENTYFFKRLKKAFRDNGFRIQKCGMQEQTKIVRKTEAFAKKYPTGNCSIQDLVSTEVWQTPLLKIPKNKLAIISSIHVAIAKAL